MITATDLCKRDGCKTHKEWIIRRCNILKSKGLLDTPFIGEITESDPVHAEVDWGRWVAKCECNGVEYVSKEEKLFYCFSCGNSKCGGKGRIVIFPNEKKMEHIEKLLNEREMMPGAGTEKLSRVLHAKPKKPGLSRTWSAGEALTELDYQNKAVKNGI